MLDERSAQLPLWSESDTTEGWQVRESRRARRLTVRVFHGGRVEVVVPARTSRAMVDRFVERHRPWIEKKRAEARRNAVPEEPFPPQIIALAGARESWRVHAGGGRGRPRVNIAGPGLLQLLGDLSSTRAVQHALRTWLVKRAAEVFAPLLEETARTMELSYRRLAVRRQRTRWGSCSIRGTISLNCCLLFQRPEVLRYLLVHELAHLRHMNHSARFWDLVARYCPDCRPLDRELLDGWRRVPSWVFRDLREPA
ncbi:MAG TPA: SprT family zinc-dependent metalloprotease [Steroidobacteraceae bacterium]|nr:SprT family zinc-dependent metalloprotease [Steroidobacteraceae bacterium]